MKIGKMFRWYWQNTYWGLVGFYGAMLFLMLLGFVIMALSLIHICCSIGHEGMPAAAKVMAYAAVCAMKDPALLQKAKEEYVKATGGKYICPVPADTKPMLDGVK